MPRTETKVRQADRILLETQGFELHHFDDREGLEDWIRYEDLTEAQDSPFVGEYVTYYHERKIFSGCGYLQDDTKEETLWIIPGTVLLRDVLAVHNGNFKAYKKRKTAEAPKTEGVTV